MTFSTLHKRGFGAVEPDETQGWAGNTPDQPKAAPFEVVGLDVIIPANNSAAQALLVCPSAHHNLNRTQGVAPNNTRRSFAVEVL